MNERFIDRIYKKKEQKLQPEIRIAISVPFYDKLAKLVYFLCKVYWHKLTFVNG